MTVTCLCGRTVTRLAPHIALDEGDHPDPGGQQPVPEPGQEPCGAEETHVRAQL